LLVPVSRRASTTTFPALFGRCPNSSIMTTMSSWQKLLTLSHETVVHRLAMLRINDLPDPVNIFAAYCILSYLTCPFSAHPLSSLGSTIPYLCHVTISLIILLVRQPPRGLRRAWICKHTRSSFWPCCSCPSAPLRHCNRDG